MRLADRTDWQPMIDGRVPVPTLLKLAETVARGKYAMAEGRHDDAIKLYEAAAALEAQVSYMEPPYWYYPVRQSLGAARFAAGDYEGAKADFMATIADRKSVVEGKSGSVRVDLGGRRFIKKKKNKKK